MSSPSRSTGFGDGVRVGPQVNSRYDSGLAGAPISPTFVYDIKPQPASFTNVAPLQTPAAAGYLSLANSGNSGTNIVELVNYQTFIKFDVPRRIQVRGVTATTLATLTVYGLDDSIGSNGFGNPVTESFSGPVGATTVTSKKCYSGIFRMFTSSGTTDNISVGCADAFGLPYVADSKNYVQPYFGGVLDSDSHSLEAGFATLNGAGSITVANSSVKANSIILASDFTQTSPGVLAIPSSRIVPGVGFEIDSTDGSDASVVSYRIEDPSYYNGTATLLAAAGPSSAVTVLTPKVNTGDIIEITVNSISGAGAPGTLSYTIVDGVSFTVTSNVAADRSSFNYSIHKPSLYAGIATLVGGAVTVPSFVVTASSQIFLSVKTGLGVTGFLEVSSISPGVSFVITSTDAGDLSVVSYIIRTSAQYASGSYILPDKTNPATLTSGNPRGVYIPSAPSDGVSRLTVYMYNRGVNNASATAGSDPTDAAQYENSVNLWGVDSYSDTTH